MRYSLPFLLLSLFSSISVHSWQVVFLHGTSCSGKSSICNELLSSKNWKVISEDDIFYDRAVQRWKTEFPEEFDAIEKAINRENLLHAVMRNQILFRVQASEQTRLKARQAIMAIQDSLNSRSRDHERNDQSSWSNALRKEITQTIIDMAQNYHVLVDTWFLKTEHLELIASHYNFKHVVLYSSIPELIQRNLKRNYDALMDGKNISIMRFFHQPLTSFTGKYGISDDKDGSIDYLEKDVLIHSLDIVKLCLQDCPEATGSAKPFTRGEFSLEEFERYRQDLLGKFTAEKAYVTAKFDFEIDKVIRTDKNSPAECAQIIRNLVE